MKTIESVSWTLRTPGAVLGLVLFLGATAPSLAFAAPGDQSTASEKAGKPAPKQAGRGDATVPGRKPRADQSAEFAKAVFAGGCFWCTEAVFEELEGVIDVVSGYAGGTEETANYRAVSGGDTGHAEAIEVTYDPQKVTFDQLLDVFFDAHDPTQLNQQGPDVGTQYRSAIFYADDTQREAAEAKIEKLKAARKFRRPIVTTLEPLEAFYIAETSHQDFATRNPNQPYVRFNSTPKVRKVREKHAELLKKKK